jgi:pSer/pThr/pTyr-binding forkhead associated (FHA) protein
MVATVVGLDGALMGKRFAVGSQPLTFGRDGGNDVVLASLLASSVHAELRPEAGGYALVDRGSSNGTWVNGVQVTTRQLRSGDEFVIGGMAFRFESFEARADGRAAPSGSAPVLHVTVTGAGRSAWALPCSWTT